ncbi:DUF7488 domain-containing protein [Caminibacter pacificus]|uniref:DUF7488 domain-containing protein n=1 Tax=Caminibacter pacificus TaxID=1424653 RepID=A0AAJ4RBG4_9BACT|nr:hypothetical protein [Caminibacter pacificus]QCI29054.1 hypothetical protein C6V80_08805 [Caminibacter pacificus]ROR39128.1 hypothetical protein EDC58_1626 [Caminibacter pacificus]
MKKLFLLIPLFAFALNLDFSACYKKFSFIKYSIPVSKTKSVTFYKPKKYIYYDPFTGLYVFRNSNAKVVKFYENPKLGWWMAGIKQNGVYAGSYAKAPIFLNMGELSVKAPKTAVVSDLFCRAYGVANGFFMPSSYLLHFVKYGYWGDVGIDVDEDMVVKYVDPFYAKGIKPGDKILKINLKPANPKTFTKYVILNKVGRAVTIKTRRGVYVLSVRKKIYNFTPLMHFGIYVDKNLYVKLPPKYKNKFFANKPIKIYAINSKRVYSFEQLKRVFSYNKNVTITFIQNGLKVKIPLRK